MKDIHTIHAPFILTKRIWKDDYGGQMIFEGLVGLKLPDIYFTCEEKPRKNLPRKFVPTWDRTRARCVTGAHATPAQQRWTWINFHWSKFGLESGTSWGVLISIWNVGKDLRWGVLSSNEVENLDYRKVGWNVMATLLSHNDGEFESCQLCEHEQELLDEVVQPERRQYSVNLLHCIGRWLS